MIQLKTKVKSRGNSLRIVLHKEVTVRDDISPKDEITITITKKDNLEDFLVS